jgi:voltage-gated potassium channel Kch
VHDFLVFVGRLAHLIHFVRGVLTGLTLTLAGLAVVLAWSEGLALGDALYFTLVTGLTVGYGDIVPTTPIGRLASLVAAVVGILFTGLYIAVATRALTEAVTVRQRRASARSGTLTPSGPTAGRRRGHGGKNED